MTSEELGLGLSVSSLNETKYGRKLNFGHTCTLLTTRKFDKCKTVLLKAREIMVGQMYKPKNPPAFRSTFRRPIRKCVKDRDLINNCMKAFGVTERANQTNPDDKSPDQKLKMLLYHKGTQGNNMNRNQTDKFAVNSK